MKNKITSFTTDELVDMKARYSEWMKPENTVWVGKEFQKSLDSSLSKSTSDGREYIKNNFDQVAGDKFSYYADVCIGYICKYNDIKLIQDDRFHTVSYANHTPRFRNDEFFDEKCESLLEEMFSLHYIRDVGTIGFIKKYYEKS